MPLFFLFTESIIDPRSGWKPGCDKLLRGKRTMKKIFVIIICILFPMTTFAGDNSYKIDYDGRVAHV
jgi:hypothetical protein